MRYGFFSSKFGTMHNLNIKYLIMGMRVVKAVITAEMTKNTILNLSSSLESSWPKFLIRKLSIIMMNETKISKYTIISIKVTLLPKGIFSLTVCMRAISAKMTELPSRTLRLKSFSVKKSPRLMQLSKKRGKYMENSPTKACL